MVYHTLFKIKKIVLFESFDYNVYRTNYSDIKLKHCFIHNNIYVREEKFFSLLENGDFSIKQMEKYKNINKEKMICLGIVNDDLLIGYILCFFKKSSDLHCKVKKSDLYITDFCIFKEHRGKGFSKLALAKVLLFFQRKFKKDYVISFICRSYNIIANKIYLSMGFKMIRTFRTAKLFGKTIRKKIEI